jgi:hypothetical protein
MTSKDKDKGGSPQGQVISDALDEKGKLYRKTGEVRATRADVATPVETVLASGHRETKNVAAPGDYIVTGQFGERYVVKPDVFASRYEPKPGTSDVYLARGYVRAAPNPLGRAIHHVAPWGEIQFGQADCMIADIYDPAEGKRAGKPYLIARAEFDRTYKPVRPAWYKK